MNRLIRTTLIILLSFILLMSSSCSEPRTAEESAQDTEYYEEKYANEPAPPQEVQIVLDFLDTIVGGQYIFGAQGHKITTEYVDSVYNMYESYFSNGRYDYFMRIASQLKDSEATFPIDYAWDCSGLWWYTCNELALFDEETDMTANGTYHTICTPITKGDLRAGDLVFVADEDGHISHMGIVGTKGYIYEAASSFVGVVKKRTIDNRIYNNIVNGGILEYNEWNVFGRPKIFE